MCRLCAGLTAKNQVYAAAWEFTPKLSSLRFSNPPVPAEIWLASRTVLIATSPHGHDMGVSQRQLFYKAAF